MKEQLTIHVDQDKQNFYKVFFENKVDLGGSEHKPLLIDIYCFFLNLLLTDQFYESVYESISLHGRIELKKGNDLIIADKSFYQSGRNYIYFEFLTLKFILVQSNHSLHAIIFEEQFLMLSKPEPATKIKSSLDAVREFSNHIPKKNSMPISREVFIVSGYSRPYHEIYDRAPFILHFYSGKPLNIICNNAFFNMTNFDNNFREIPVSSDEDINSQFRLPILVSTPPLSRADKELIRQQFATSALENITPISELVEPEFDLVIWLGNCDEKRNVTNLYEIINIFLNALCRTGYRSLVVVDGMTSPYFVAQKKNSDFKIGDSLFQKSYENLSFIDLNGSPASIKLAIASRVDFFFSNGLTDSIWCSFFASKPGIIYCSNSSRSEVILRHLHPLCVLLPEEFVEDLTSLPNNTRDSFSLNIDGVRKILDNSIKYLLSIKKMCLAKYMAEFPNYDFYLIICEPGRYFIRVMDSKYIAKDAAFILQVKSDSNELIASNIEDKKILEIEVGKIWVPTKLVEKFFLYRYEQGLYE